MESIYQNMYQWGLDIIRFIQHYESPTLSLMMKIITSLGSELAYLAVLPLIFWCIDERRGLRLGTAVLLSAWLNGTVKNVLKQPRPYQLDPSVGRAVEDSYGIPSGHAQRSLTFWGIIGGWIRQPLGLILAVALPLLISFSRLYLGVHFPTDLFAGWILALSILGTYYLGSESIEKIFNTLNIRFKILTVALIAFIMNGLNPQDTSMGGAFFGITTGYFVMIEYFAFSARHNARGKSPRFRELFLRYLIGMTGAGIIYVSLKQVFPGESSPWYAMGRFIRYGLLGFWTSAGAPWVFLGLKLAGSESTVVNQ
ncbi:phosphatase PAP2 family protein [Gracilinema caldarium]|uniref:Phosphoesterase PA-phosphatase related protein n=1 Tax=Gracilinema caldarium (strain ATCC 51460 / DSM 7334 / H1) TaxID=744872 RepID=F8F0T3_GRAC1|nr:phosphatase PAP2 family protein [Gracilinema caldarium]AEJ20219.1 phosphoesterase PA-phosphatase related protein [Gracilinema caldarium DSM 7334]